MKLLLIYIKDKETDQPDKKKKNNKKKESKNEDGFKRPKKEMPNYFISLQITNPEVSSIIDIGVRYYRYTGLQWY